MGRPNFEWFVAGRYLRSRRRDKVVSVVTVISVAGVAAGVLALVIALAVNNGFRDTLQNALLSATAHVNVVRKESGQGVADWRGLSAKLKTLPQVTAVAPVLYQTVYINGPQGGKGVELKGVDKAAELSTSDVLRHLTAGSIDNFGNDGGGLPGIILGSAVAADAGLSLNSVATVINPEGTLTPFGPETHTERFRVVGIFESGFYNFDDNWAFVSLADSQRLLSVGDVVNDIELRCDDPAVAPDVAKAAEKAAGNRYSATNWQDQNAPLLHALHMERVVTTITIGLIELVAALNIVIALTMIVLTKYRDIAVLMSMGTKRGQIAKIFLTQGAMIGLTGIGIGLATGYSFCYFADKYRWISLDASVYSLSFVPFSPNPVDGVWIAAVALVVSLLAAAYPARNATRISPVEVLRYE